MTFKLYKLFLIVLVLFTMNNCKNKEQTLSVKDPESKQIDVFGEVSKLWQFSTTELTPAAQIYINGWEEYRVFNEETKTKPLATISAFQQKSKSLTEKVSLLENTLPPFYQTPAIKSRLKVLTTHFQSLDMYLHLDNIPVKKIKYYLTEINQSWRDLHDKMNEIQYKSVIPKEEGEQQMIKLNDTIKDKSSENEK